MTEKKPASKEPRPPAGPSTDEIAAAAYLIYRRRIDEGLPGNHEADWQMAEQELARKKQIPPEA